MIFCFDLTLKHSKFTIINEVIDITKRNGFVQIGIFISLKFCFECGRDITFYRIDLAYINLLKCNTFQIKKHIAFIKKEFCLPCSYRHYLLFPKIFWNVFEVVYGYPLSRLCFTKICSTEVGVIFIKRIR